jgi:hypothetical protein
MKQVITRINTNLRVITPILELKDLKFIEIKTAGTIPHKITIAPSPLVMDKRPMITP